jgi:hypothetical protein
MALTCDEIGKLLTRIQADFLEIPGLRVTLEEAVRRFHVERPTCEAILAALVDGHVLVRDASERYRRRAPAGNHAATNHRPVATVRVAA